jgi:hypothetical protein
VLVYESLMIRFNQQFLPLQVPNGEGLGDHGILLEVQ